MPVSAMPLLIRTEMRCISSMRFQCRATAVMTVLGVLQDWPVVWIWTFFGDNRFCFIKNASSVRSAQETYVAVADALMRFSSNAGRALLRRAVVEKKSLPARSAGHRVTLTWNTKENSLTNVIRYKKNPAFDSGIFFMLFLFQSSISDCVSLHFPRCLCR